MKNQFIFNLNSNGVSNKVNKETSYKSRQQIHREIQRQITPPFRHQKLLDAVEQQAVQKVETEINQQVIKSVSHPVREQFWWQVLSLFRPCDRIELVDVHLSINHFVNLHDQTKEAVDLPPIS